MKQIVILVQAETLEKAWEGLAQLASEKHHDSNAIGTCGEKADVNFDYSTEETNAYPALATHYDEIKRTWNEGINAVESKR